MKLGTVSPYILASYALVASLGLTARASEMSDARAAFGRGDIHSALAALQSASDHGDVDAETALGIMLYDGVGVPYDPERAFPILLRAAQKGSVGAMLRVGHVYNIQDNAIGRPPKLPAYDYDSGRKWYARIAKEAPSKAEAGDPYAQEALGWLTRGVESLDWYTKAAGQGLPTAQFSVGQLYDPNAGGKEPQKAREWYLKAAKAGSANAELNLGVMCSQAGDRTEAIKWLSESALLGNAIASGILKRDFGVRVGNPTLYEQQQEIVRRASEGLERDAQTAVTKSRLGFATAAFAVGAIEMLIAESRSGHRGLTSSSSEPSFDETQRKERDALRSDTEANLLRYYKDKDAQEDAAMAHQEELEETMRENAREEMMRSQAEYDATHQGD